MTNRERDGEYAPTGEQGGTDATFHVDDIASAFDIQPDRIRQAIVGEFGSEEAPVGSRQAQHLAEVLLGDLPQSARTAALVKLGAFTPRADHVEGLGEKDPAEESDKLAEDINDIREEHE